MGKKKYQFNTYIHISFKVSLLKTSVLWKYFYHFLIYIFKEHLKNDFFYPLYNFKFLKKNDDLPFKAFRY